MKPQRLSNKFFEDRRGSFTKVFDSTKGELLPDFSIKEIFFTESNKGVIRGLHFQLPPLSQSKMITVVSGSIYEVFVDLRKDSVEFGVPRSVTLEAGSTNGGSSSSFFIPSGFAHGYQCLEQGTVVLYCADFPFDPALDSGIHINSFDIDWPIKEHILSSKDESLPLLFDTTLPY